MTSRFIPWLLTCVPLVLAIAAWVELYRRRKKSTLSPVVFVALGLASANALLAASEFTYYEFRPAHFVAPWNDPQILALASLFLLAPAAMIAGAVAAARGAPKWLICIVEIASIPLLIIGFFASAAV
jgi:hypothetical protein